MSFISAAILLATVFSTAVLSGIFGMAGGIILLWVMMLLLPVAAAIAMHGLIQISSNLSRAWFSRAYVDWRIFGISCLGLATAAILLLIVGYTPEKLTVLIVVGLMPIIIWMPQGWFQLDASRPGHAFVAGFVSGGLNLAVGTSGALMDLFFVRTEMDRRTVVATKAVFQIVNHVVKFAFYWRAVTVLGFSEWSAVMIAMPVAIAATHIGYSILQRMTDTNFRYWMRLIVTVIGIVYLAEGLMLIFEA